MDIPLASQQPAKQSVQFDELARFGTESTGPTASQYALIPSSIHFHPLARYGNSDAARLLVTVIPDQAYPPRLDPSQPKVPRQFIEAIAFAGDDRRGVRELYATSFWTDVAYEAPLAVVPANPIAAGRFTNYEVFVCSGGGDCVISQLDYAGKILNSTWCTLPAQNTSLSGICFDTDGLYGGRLLVVDKSSNVYAIRNIPGVADAPDQGEHQLLFNLADLIAGDQGVIGTEGIAIAPMSFGPLASQIIIPVEGDGSAYTGRIYAVKVSFTDVLVDNAQATYLANIAAAEGANFVPDAGKWNGDAASFLGRLPSRVPGENTADMPPHSSRQRPTGYSAG